MSVSFTKKLIEYADEFGVEIIIKGFSYKPSLSFPHYFAFYLSRCFSMGCEWLDLFGNNKYSNSDHY
jgi:hypothetical protein